MESRGGTPKVDDALGYLEEVKNTFDEDSPTYDEFLDVMKGFKSELLTTPQVIQRVQQLFAGHPKLISGFNQFLPDETKITTAEGHGDGSDVDPRSREPVQDTRDGRSPADDDQYMDDGDDRRRDGGQDAQAQELDQAVEYVAMIKQRFLSKPGVYEQFLEILHEFQSQQQHAEGAAQDEAIVEVKKKVRTLFAEHPDLLEKFSTFLPQDDRDPGRGRGGPQQSYRHRFQQRASSAGGRQRGASGGGANRHRSRSPHSPSPPRGAARGAAHHGGAGGEYYDQRRQRRRHERYDSRGRSARYDHYNQYDRAGGYDDRANGGGRSRRDREYDIRDRSVGGGGRHRRRDYDRRGGGGDRYDDRFDGRRSGSHHDRYYDGGAGPQEFTQRERIRMYEREQHEIAMERRREKNAKSQLSEYFNYVQGEEFKGMEPVTPSYRLLPKDLPQPTCTARKPYMQAVLNDHAVSMSAGTEDNSSKISVKNPHEEKMFRLEDERFATDLLIDRHESILQRLRPALEKLRSMTAEEAQSFDSSTLELSVVHVSCIKVMYGESGADIIQLLNESPATAIPVLYDRVHRKVQEWRCIRTSSIDMWRKVAMDNYARSLDHRSLNFKAEDRKSINPRNLIKELVESYAETQLRLADFDSGDEDSRENLTGGTIDSTLVCPKRLVGDSLFVSNTDVNAPLSLPGAAAVPRGDQSASAPAESSPSSMSDEESAAAAAQSSSESSSLKRKRDEGTESGTAADKSAAVAAITEPQSKKQKSDADGSGTAAAASVAVKVEQPDEQPSVSSTSAPSPSAVDAADASVKVEETPSSGSSDDAGSRSPSSSGGGGSGEEEKEQLFDYAMDFHYPDDAIHRDAFRVLYPLVQESYAQEELPEFRAFWYNLHNMLFGVVLDDIAESKEDLNEFRKLILEVDFPKLDVEMEAFARSEKFDPLRRHDRPSRFFVCNGPWYLFLRAHQLLYSRLSLAKQLATERAEEINRRSAAAHSGGGDSGEHDVTPEGLYEEFLELLCKFLVGTGEAEFEEETRRLLGQRSYEFFTLDKLLFFLMKQGQAVIWANNNLNLFRLFIADLKGAERFPVTDERLQAMRRMYMYSAARMCDEPQGSLPTLAVQVEFFTDTKRLGISICDRSMFPTLTSAKARWHHGAVKEVCKPVAGTGAAAHRRGQALRRRGHGAAGGVGGGGRRDRSRSSESAASLAESDTGIVPVPVDPGTPPVMPQRPPLVGKDQEMKDATPRSSGGVPPPPPPPPPPASSTGASSSAAGTTRATGTAPPKSGAMPAAASGSATEAVPQSAGRRRPRLPDWLINLRLSHPRRTALFIPPPPIERPTTAGAAVAVQASDVPASTPSASSDASPAPTSTTAAPSAPSSAGKDEAKAEPEKVDDAGTSDKTSEKPSDKMEDDVSENAEKDSSESSSKGSDSSKSESEKPDAPSSKDSKSDEMTDDKDKASSDSHAKESDSSSSSGSSDAGKDKAMSDESEGNAKPDKEEVADGAAPMEDDTPSTNEDTKEKSTSESSSKKDEGEQQPAEDEDEDEDVVVSDKEENEDEPEDENDIDREWVTHKQGLCAQLFRDDALKYVPGTEDVFVNYKRTVNRAHFNANRQRSLARFRNIWSRIAPKSAPLAPAKTSSALMHLRERFKKGIPDAIGPNSGPHGVPAVHHSHSSTTVAHMGHMSSSSMYGSVPGSHMPHPHAVIPAVPAGGSVSHVGAPANIQPLPLPHPPHAPGMTSHHPGAPGHPMRPTQAPPMRHAPYFGGFPTSAAGQSTATHMATAAHPISSVGAVGSALLSTGLSHTHAHAPPGGMLGARPPPVPPCPPGFTHMQMQGSVTHTHPAPGRFGTLPQTAHAHSQGMTPTMAMNATRHVGTSGAIPASVLPPPQFQAAQLAAATHAAMHAHSTAAPAPMQAGVAPSMMYHPMTQGQPQLVQRSAPSGAYAPGVPGPPPGYVTVQPAPQQVAPGGAPASAPTHAQQPPPQAQAPAPRRPAGIPASRSNNGFAGPIPGRYPSQYAPRGTASQPRHPPPSVAQIMARTTPAPSPTPPHQQVHAAPAPGNAQASSGSGVATQAQPAPISSNQAAGISPSQAQQQQQQPPQGAPYGASAVAHAPPGGQHVPPYGTVPAQQNGGPPRTGAQPQPGALSQRGRPGVPPGTMHQHARQQRLAQQLQQTLPFFPATAARHAPGAAGGASAAGAAVGTMANVGGGGYLPPPGGVANTHTPPGAAPAAAQSSSTVPHMAMTPQAAAASPRGALMPPHQQQYAHQVPQAAAAGAGGVPPTQYRPPAATGGYAPPAAAGPRPSAPMRGMPQLRQAPPPAAGRGGGVP